MTDYSNGKIYKIVSESKGLTYIGSTTKDLNIRLKQHKYKYNTFKKNNISYVSVNDVLECDDVKIELIENYPCNCRKELEKKEGEYIKNTQCVNNNIAGQTPEEWRLENIENYKEYQKEWRENNKDKSKAYQKEYYENNKDKCKEYYQNNKEEIMQRQKIWNETHKETQKEYMKKWREDNKDKIKKYYEDNKDKWNKEPDNKKEYMKEYYQKNKTKLKEYYKKKYQLEKKLFVVFEGLIKLHDLEKNKVIL